MQQHLQNHEDRLNKMQGDLQCLFDRMGKVEDKASGAWKTINEVNTKVDNLDKRVQGLEYDVKEVKVSQDKMGKTLKVITVICSITLVISLGFFAYIWKHDAELAKSILALGTSVATHI